MLRTSSGDRAGIQTQVSQMILEKVFLRLTSKLQVYSSHSTSKTLPQESNTRWAQIFR